MESEFANINWLAVWVGTIAAFFFGMVWYNPRVLGLKWAEGSKLDMSTAPRLPVFAMVTQAIALFFLAVVVGFTATTDALLTAILAILAVAVFLVSMGAFVQKSTAALVIDGGYVVLCGVIMIIAQGIF